MLTVYNICLRKLETNITTHSADWMYTECQVHQMLTALQQRVEQLSSDQDTREMWTVAMISKNHVQSWYLQKIQHACKCTPLVSFTISTISPGFQMWYRWLASTSQVGTSVCGMSADDLIWKLHHVDLVAQWTVKMLLSLKAQSVGVIARLSLIYLYLQALGYLAWSCHQLSALATSRKCITL